MSGDTVSMYATAEIVAATDYFNAIVRQDSGANLGCGATMTLTYQRPRQVA